MLSGIGRQPAEHRRSGDGAGADRCGEPQQFVPMRGDMTQCDRLGRHASEQLARFLARQEVQATLPDIAEARREAVVEERHEAEHRSEEHTSELQSLMRISYAVFCLYKKTD